jgi:hypothetical protein
MFFCTRISLPTLWTSVNPHVVQESASLVFRDENVEVVFRDEVASNVGPGVPR